MEHSAAMGATIVPELAQFTILSSFNVNVIVHHIVHVFF